MFYIATSLHFEDRIVGTNLVGTIVINFIALLSAYMGNGFGMDIALVYAFLSFLAVVVLCRLLAVQNVERTLEEIENRERKEKESRLTRKERSAAKAAARHAREAQSELLRRQMEALRDHREGGSEP
jgi:multisubunit Na+/H+ antiporter MnhF subunit